MLCSGFAQRILAPLTGPGSGVRSGSGRRPCRAPSGGSPTGAPPPGRVAPHPQVGDTPRYAAPMGRACKRGPDPSSVPGILSPRKITVKGARYARVLRMARAPLLTVIFPGKTIGTYRLDGAVRAPPSPRLRKEREKPGPRGARQQRQRS